MNKTKTKKKNWLVDSYRSLKDKFTKRPIMEAEDV
jgi:hypothetical protein